MRQFTIFGVRINTWGKSSIKYLLLNLLGQPIYFEKHLMNLNRY
jgi:hypothetical protein